MIYITYKQDLEILHEEWREGRLDEKDESDVSYGQDGKMRFFDRMGGAYLKTFEDLGKDKDKENEKDEFYVFINVWVEYWEAV